MYPVRGRRVVVCNLAILPIQKNIQGAKQPWLGYRLKITGTSFECPGPGSKIVILTQIKYFLDSMNLSIAIWRTILAHYINIVLLNNPLDGQEGLGTESLTCRSRSFFFYVIIGFKKPKWYATSYLFYELASMFNAIWGSLITEGCAFTESY